MALFAIRLVVEPVLADAGKYDCTSEVELGEGLGLGVGVGAGQGMVE